MKSIIQAKKENSEDGLLSYLSDKEILFKKTKQQKQDVHKNLKGMGTNCLLLKLLSLLPSV